MSELPFTIPERFLPAYQSIKQLEQQDMYLAAFIFGSLARGETTTNSDVDVHVIVNEDNLCKNINHPIINGIKLDISFRSLNQVRTSTDKEIETRERVPMIAESIIVFDKTGELTRLKEVAKQVQPRVILPVEYQFIQFMFFHANNKVERNLETNTMTALLAMHVGLNDLLHWHYRLQQKWWVSSKRLLGDLRSWDYKLADFVEGFLATSEVQAKFQFWSAIIDHILEPLGGRQPISENNCNCDVCQRDLAILLKS